MIANSDYCEELRQRAVAVLSAAQRALALHPENSHGKMAPSVAAAAIEKAAAITRQLDALANAARVLP